MVHQIPVGIHGGEFSTAPLGDCLKWNALEQHLEVQPCDQKKTVTRVDCRSGLFIFEM